MGDKFPVATGHKPPVAAGDVPPAATVNMFRVALGGASPVATGEMLQQTGFCCSRSYVTAHVLARLLAPGLHGGLQLAVVRASSGAHHLQTAEHRRRHGAGREP